MIKKKFNYLLAGTSWLFLFVISMFLKPHGDDFEFLYYFKIGMLEVIIGLTIVSYYRETTGDQ